MITKLRVAPFHLVSVMVLAACGTGPEPGADDAPEAAGEAPNPRRHVGDVTVPGDRGPLELDGNGVTAPTCTLALTGTPACGSGLACASDTACAAHPGNYCAPAACSVGECLTGRCTITKITGEACTRNEECVSHDCVCEDEGDACVCGPGGGTPWST